MDISLLSIAFYNVENLFDYTDGKHTLDKDFTPKGKKKWGPYRYQLKIEKIGKVLSKIGDNLVNQPPVFIGLAEVENKKVLTDLLASEYLKYLPYDFVHYDSPDERGIDVALIFNKELFEIIETKNIPVVVYNEKNIRDYTRDILFVKGIWNGELVHVFINHWPSKRDGHDKTKNKRIEIAKLIHQQIEKIEIPNPKIIVMGDYNDNPTDESIQKHLVKNRLQNPMEVLFEQGLGSSKFYGQWMLFDQIIISSNFHHPQSNLQFEAAHIYDEGFLKNPRGKFTNEPFRTYIGKYYLGGYSDHFPVFLTFSVKK